MVKQSFNSNITIGKNQQSVNLQFVILPYWSFLNALPIWFSPNIKTSLTSSIEPHYLKDTFRVFDFVIRKNLTRDEPIRALQRVNLTCQRATTFTHHEDHRSPTTWRGWVVNLRSSRILKINWINLCKWKITLAGLSPRLMIWHISASALPAKLSGQLI